MDWNKSKTIIIIALLITNLLLLGLNIGAWREQNRDSASERAETIALLESRGIYLDTEIPEKHERMSALNLEHRIVDRAALEAVLEECAGAEPVDPDRTEQVLQLGRTVMEALGLWQETMTAEFRTEENGTLCLEYGGNYENMPIDGSFARFYISEGRLTDAELFWMDPVGEGPKKLDTISAAAALISFMSQQGDQDVLQIRSMELVYWMDTEGLDTEALLSDTALPAWRIVYNDGLVAHVPALQE